MSKIYEPMPTSGAEAVIYARVSSREQEREGFSIQAQQRLLHDYAAQRRLKIVREFVDVETAKTTGRKHFGEMLKFLSRSRTVTTILVEKTDRLHRNLADWAKVWEKVENLGVDLHLVKENAIIGKNASSNEKFIYSIKASLAKLYIDNLSEEARKGMLEKAAQGIYPSAAPLGYLNTTGPDGKKIIVVNHEMAPVIRHLYERYAVGDASLDDACAAARNMGLGINRSGRPISRSTAHKILRNPIFMGEFDWKGRRYKGTHEPIVDRDLWQAVQNRLDGRNAKRYRRVKHDFAYARLMTCGHCGAAIVGEIKKGKYVYYHCTEHKGTCDDPYTRERDLDEQFAAVLESLRFDDEILRLVRAALIESHADMHRHHEEAIERLQAEYRRLQHRIDQVYVDKIDGVVTVAFFEEKAGEWRKLQEQCLRSIETHQNANGSYMDDGIRLLELANSAGRLFRKQSGAEKRRLLEFVVSNSTLAKGRLAVELRQPFDMMAETATATRGGSGSSGSENSENASWLGN